MLLSTFSKNLENEISFIISLHSTKILLFFLLKISTNIFSLGKVQEVASYPWGRVKV